MRAFTLVELQVSLLLTILVMALLFLFTGMFWANYEKGRNLDLFHRDTLIFINFIERKIKSSIKLEIHDHEIIFQTSTGEEVIITQSEQGPIYESQPFFHEKVQFNIQRSETQDWTVYELELIRSSDGFIKKTSLVCPKVKTTVLLEWLYAN